MAVATVLTALITILIPLLVIGLVVGLVIWTVRTITRSREASATEAAYYNELVIQHLRNMSERLDRIERQLSEIPE